MNVLLVLLVAIVIGAVGYVIAQYKGIAYGIGSFLAGVLVVRFLA